MFSLLSLGVYPSFDRSTCEVVAAIKILFLSSFKQVLKYVERKRRCSASVGPAVWYKFIDAIVNTQRDECLNKLFIKREKKLIRYSRVASDKEARWWLVIHLIDCSGVTQRPNHTNTIDGGSKHNQSSQLYGDCDEYCVSSIC